MKEQECRVSVFVTTYNHEKYIRQCLDSMVSQKTDFPFEIIVRDDASTDSTSDIVREYGEKYPGLVIPYICEFNHHSRGMTNESFRTMFGMSHGKYIASCEGDDFWTDPGKLQLQTDYMEAHPECTLCFTSSYYANPDGTIKEGQMFRTYTSSRDLTTEEVISDWVAPSNTLVYRRSSMEEDVIIPFRGICVNEDYARIVYLAMKGTIHYIDQPTGAYRFGVPGSFSNDTRTNPEAYKSRTLEFANMLDRMDEYYGRKYTKLIQREKARQLFDMYANLEDKENMKKYLHEAYGESPFVWRTLETIRTFAPGTMNKIKNLVRRNR